MQPYIYGRSPTPKSTFDIYRVPGHAPTAAFLASQPASPVTIGEVVRNGGTPREWECHLGVKRPHNAKRVTLRTHRTGR